MMYLYSDRIVRIVVFSNSNIYVFEMTIKYMGTTAAYCLTMTMHDKNISLFS